MRRILTCFILLIMITIGGSSISFADVDGSGNIIFGDNTLRDYIAGATIFDDNSDGEISPTEALDITSLNISNSYAISDLGGLEYFTNLEHLYIDDGTGISDLTPISGISGLLRISIDYSSITDLTPISGMTSLTTVEITQSSLSDISALENLVNIDTVGFLNCNISDISVLANFPSLSVAVLQDNNIGDISPLSGLDNLFILVLSNNPIYDETTPDAVRREHLDFTVGATPYEVWTLASDNNSLSSLSFSDGSLSPTFDSATTTYSTTVVGNTNNIVQVSVTPTMEESNASVKVNGENATSGQATDVYLGIGNSTITILVTAENGDEKTYTIDVTRVSDNNLLSDLSFDSGTLSPTFDSATTSYSTTVVGDINSIKQVNVTPTLDDSTASVTVNGENATSGQVSSVYLGIGNSTITIVVTAESGDEKTYSINVTRVGSNNNALSALDVDVSTLMPTFDSNVFNYTVNVDNEIETVAYNDSSVTSGSAITISLSTENTEASIAFNGTDIDGTTTSWNDSLVVGDNTITITVTAENGNERDYVIVASRDTSSNNNLSNIVLSESGISPTFDNNITSYAMSVDYDVTELGFTVSGVVSGAAITVNPIVDDSTAGLDINGETLGSSDEVVVDLAKGDNTIVITVTAEDGSEKTYSIVATRGESSNYYLSNILVDNGNYSIDFDRDTNYYSVNVPYSKSRITITAVKEHEDAAIEIDGQSVTSGTASGNLVLVVGNNTIDIEVTAGNGDIKIYRVNIARARASSNKDDDSQSDTVEETEEVPTTEETTTIEAQTVYEEEKTVVVTTEVVSTTSTSTNISVTEKKTASVRVASVSEDGVSKATVSEELIDLILSESLVGEAFETSNPVEEAPIREDDVTDELLIGETPVEEIPIENLPIEEIPLEEVPDEDTSLGDSSADVQIKQIEVVIQIDSEDENLEVEVPVQAFQKLAQNNVSGFRIETKNEKVRFDSSAISNIKDQAKSSVVKLRVQRHERIDTDKSEIVERPAVSLVLDDAEDIITDFGEGEVDVAISYALKEGESEESIIVYYLTPSGDLEIVRGGYDPKSQYVNFKTNHFSYYIIGHNPIEFKDVQEDEWYYKAVRYIAARNISTGSNKGDRLFGADEKITRGQLIIMLMDSYGIEPLDDIDENESEAEEPYYSDYLSKAKELGLVDGTGNVAFSPDQTVSRQELFVLVYNTLKYSDELPEAVYDVDISNYIDYNDIEPWAENAIDVLVEARIITGSKLGHMEPLSETTRGELVQLLYNLLN